jgi:peroxiredoxin
MSATKAPNRPRSDPSFQSNDNSHQNNRNQGDEAMSATLSQQLDEFLAGWMQRVPADRRAAMERHIAHLSETGIGKNAKQVGDQAPGIVLPDVHGEPFDVAGLLAKGPVIVTFYRGGWCPYCNLELKAYQAVLPRIAAAGASLVAISPEKPDDTVSTAEKNALTYPVLSDVGQKVGKAFGLVYSFTDELRAVYDGFKLDIPGRNGSPDDWSLPLSATYVVGKDGIILFADTSVDYRRRTDPMDVLQVLERRVAAE